MLQMTRVDNSPDASSEDKSESGYSGPVKDITESKTGFFANGLGARRSGH
jgi:hypothetical protein